LSALAVPTVHVQIPAVVHDAPRIMQTLSTALHCSSIFTESQGIICVKQDIREKLTSSKIKTKTY
jgi:hypothetical protein